VSRGRSAVALLALGAAAAANLAFLSAEPLDGMLTDARSRVVAAAVAALASLAAGWSASGLVTRGFLIVTAILVLLIGGVTPALAVGAPILLALLTRLARDLDRAADHPARLRVHLFVFAAVGLGGPPLVALAHSLA
jgi:hypothetical protein